MKKNTFLKRIVSCFLSVCMTFGNAAVMPVYADTPEHGAVSQDVQVDAAKTSEGLSVTVSGSVYGDGTDASDIYRAYGFSDPKLSIGFDRVKDLNGNYSVSSVRVPGDSSGRFYRVFYTMDPGTLYENYFTKDELSGTTDADRVFSMPAGVKAVYVRYSETGNGELGFTADITLDEGSSLSGVSGYLYDSTGLFTEINDYTQDADDLGRFGVYVMRAWKNISAERGTTTYSVPLRAPAGAPMLRGTSDGIYIRELKAALIRGAATTPDGKVWTARNSTPGHPFTFRITYSISGVDVAEPGEVVMTIPKQILRNRAGNLADSYEMSIPSREDVESGEEMDEDISFAFYEDGSNIVIYNIKEVPAGDNGYIELNYVTTESSYSYRDMGPSDPFVVTMKIGDGTGENRTKSTDPITVKINTTAAIRSTSKKYPTMFRTWNSAWGTAPADSSDYWYLVWEVHSSIDSTQPFNFTFADNVTARIQATDGTWYDMPIEFVGARFAGSSRFTNNLTQNSQRTDGVRYDAVLTRFKYADYQNHDGKDCNHWEITNTITATVDPVDQVDPDTKAVSVRKWVWDKPEFYAPTGHFYGYKRADGAHRRYNGSIYTNTTHRAPSLTMKAADYTRYDLEEFEEKTDVNAEYNGFDYASWIVGYPYPWTRDPSYGVLDPAGYGRIPVTYQLTDEGVHFDYDPGRMLTSDDFYFETLGFSYYMRDAAYDDEDKIFREIAPSYTNNDILTFYGKFGTGSEFVQFGTYNIKTGAKNFDPAYVASMTDTKITFSRKDLVAYRVTTSNAHYFTEIFTVPNLVLKNSAYVHNYVNDDGTGHTRDVIGIVNHNESEAFTNAGARLIDVKQADTDYARISERDSSIRKRPVAGTNNVKKRYYSITWKSEVKETITFGQYGETDYIPQESGRFYDLLPAGGVLDPDSVQISTDKGYMSSSAFKVTTLDNYKGTGQTMLIVDILEPAKYYTIYYDSRHSWNSVKDYGTLALNSVAYETGNPSITHGQPDNGGSIREKTLISGLIAETAAEGYTPPTETADKTHTAGDPAFLFADTTYDIVALMAANSGLMKKVKDSTDTSYSYSTMTTINGNYSYEIRFQNTPGNKAKDMIFFDSLENYYLAQTPGASDYVSDWRGTLTGIDISELQAKGIAPKIYISTISALDLEDHHDLTEAGVWTEVTNLTSANLAPAKAIAIDIRKKTDNTDFILDEGQSVVTHLYMDAGPTAPQPSSGTGYPYAYNNIYISDTIFDDPENEVNYFIHQDFTKIGLYVAADFNLHKVSSENETEAIPRITFRLYGTSSYGTEIDERLTTNNSGNISFKKIEMGQYILQEYASTDDWLLDTTEHSVTVTNTGNVIIDGVDYTNGTITLANRPRIHGDLTFYKREFANFGTPSGDDNGVAIPGVTFRLSGTSDYGNDILMYETSSITGRVRFRNIEKGTYELKEISTTNNAFLLNDTPFTVRVDENGLASITTINEYHETLNDQEIILNESRYFDFLLRKIDRENGGSLQGATFRLTGTSDLGTPTDKTVISDANGLARFTGIEKGTYVLQETQAPKQVDADGHTGTGGNRNYIADPTLYAVKIERDGTVTISGLTMTGGMFNINNDRALDGRIIVTKIWEDTREDDDRPVPILHLTTVDPSKKKLYVTYNANNGAFTGGDTQNVVVYMKSQQ